MIAELVPIARVAKCRTEFPCIF